MPPSRYKIKRSELAKSDLATIKAFTIERFGKQQWPIYRERLQQAIDAIATTPTIGASVEALSAGLRCHHVNKGSHYIYYRVQERTIFIVRIIHESRNQSRMLYP